MDTYNAPTLGLVELPELSELCRQLGYRVISGPTFQEAATAVKTELDAAYSRGDDNSARFPIIIADGRKPGIKAWTQKLAATSPILILRTSPTPDNDYIVADGTRELRLPATVGDILAYINFPAPQDARAGYIVEADGSIQGATPPQPAYTETPTAPAFGNAPQAAPVADPWAQAAAAPAAPARAPWDTRPAEAEPAVRPFVDESTFERAPQTIFPDPEPVAQQPWTPQPATPQAAPVQAAPDWAGNAPAGWPQPAAPQPVAAAPVYVEPVDPVAHGRRAAPAPVEEQWQQVEQVNAPFVDPHVQPPAPQQAAPAFPQAAPAFPQQPAAPIEEPMPAWAQAAPTGFPVPPAPVTADAEGPSWAASAEQIAPVPTAAEPAWATPPVQPAPAPAPAPIHIPEQVVQAPAPTYIPEPVAPAAPAYTPAYTEPNLFAEHQVKVSNRHAGPACPVIFDWAYKGGVNKTSITLGLSHRASGHGRLRVVAVDMNRGQGGIRTMLRIQDNAPIRSAYDAAQTGDPSRAIVLPDELRQHRSSSLEPIDFSVVLAPPRAVADAGSTSALAYKQIIDHARHMADLVIVDTQTVEAADNTGLIDKVMVPLMIEDAWGVAITEFGKESVDNLLAAFRMYERRGLGRERQLLAVTRVQGFTAEDATGVERKFGEFARFAGTTAVSSHVKEEFDRGRIISDDPAVKPLLDQILLQVTGNPAFDEEANRPKRRGLFGGGGRR